MALSPRPAEAPCKWPGAGELEIDSVGESGDPGPASPEVERALGCTTTFFRDNKMSAVFSPWCSTLAEL